MHTLLLAEAYVSGADSSKIIVNAELKAGDEGCDALTPGAPSKNQWLAQVHTCWQLKAGKASQPARLKGEIQKRIPSMTLRSGGRFVLIASGAGEGSTGIERRLRALKAAAARAKIPSARVEVFSCEMLATWINEHPAVAAKSLRMPQGFRSLGAWANDQQHRDPWVTSPKVDEKLAQLRGAIDFEAQQAILHQHVYGRPGIGKSRFVLEACRSSAWAQSVLYVDQYASADVTGILASVVRAGVGRLVLVVDEVPTHQVKSLASAAIEAPDRVRVISIGVSESPDAGIVPQLQVEALDEDTISKIVKAAHPGLPDVHVRYVARFSDGYVRLARLAARAVETNPHLLTADLFNRGDIRQLMDGMLGGESRRPLHVLAVLSSVGWSGAREEEGKAIARHFGQDWFAVQAGVQRFHDRFGIAPRAHNLRYISPTPLGVFLALDALQSYPDQFRTLQDILPNEQAKRAFNERLKSIVADPRAREFAEDELSRFRHWSHFKNASAVERWVTFSYANPPLAAANVRSLLQSATDEERRQIVGAARRKLVDALVHFGARTDTFRDAMLALAELAAAETERYVNNSQGEFGARFNLMLSGTACPYKQRLLVLDELLDSGRSELEALAIAALSRAGRQQEMLIVNTDPARGPGPISWRPQTHDELLDCVHAAFARLAKAARLNAPTAQLLGAATDLDIRLRDMEVRESVADFLRAVALHHPDVRPQIRRGVLGVARNTRRFWKDLDESAMAWLDAFAEEFADRTAASRLRELVAELDRDGADDKDFDDVARQLVADKTLLWSEWGWLTTSNGRAVWDLGAALGRADDGSLLAPLMAAYQREGDPRLFAGYLGPLGRNMSREWIDEWLDEQERSRALPAPLILDLTWKLTESTRGAHRITRMVRAGQLAPASLSWLALGAWINAPDTNAVRDLLGLMTLPELREHVLALLDIRLDKRPEELPMLEDIALSTVGDEATLRLHDATALYHWDKLARRLLPKHTRVVAGAIFKAQAKDAHRGFFLEHSPAASTLDACVSADASVVWNELALRLNDENGAAFSIGFPRHVLERLPRDRVLEWIAAAPGTRAVLVADMMARDFGDNSLAAAILDRWNGIPEVAQRFFSSFVFADWWSGDASVHWETLALRVEQIGAASAKRGVRRWAIDAARELRSMADADRRREAEEKLRRFGTGW
jgi:hypothetical protein